MAASTVVPVRLPEPDFKTFKAVQALEGKSASVLMREILIPAIRSRLAQHADARRGMLS